MEPNEHAWRAPLKTGIMILNRFCIDEEASFELSGVYDLKKTSYKLKRKEKGKQYSFAKVIFINLIFMNN